MMSRRLLSRQVGLAMRPYSTSAVTTGNAPFKVPTTKGTASVWAGEIDDNASVATPPSAFPVHLSVSFDHKNVDEWLDVAQQRAKGHIYSRNTNPTLRAFENKVRILEGGEAATSFASGMAAISNTLFTLLSPGDHVVSVKDTYGGTNLIFNEFLPRFGIKPTLCETSDYEAIEHAVSQNNCKVLYLETPTNPTLKVLDIERLSRKAKEHGAVVVVDNTFATPINQNPLMLGADLVLHSATKFLGGHADALGGVLVGRKDLINQVYHYREITGASLGAMDAYLLMRGMKTLSLRVKHQNESAMKIAHWLQKHPKVEAVFYPGLADHKYHDVAKQQMAGFGGMLSFSVKSGFEGIKRLVPELVYAHRAANLGAVDTVAGPPIVTSHVECTPEERAAAGIPEGLLRYSVGIEDTEDLIADLEQALKYA